MVVKDFFWKTTLVITKDNIQIMILPIWITRLNFSCSTNKNYLYPCIMHGERLKFGEGILVFYLPLQEIRSDWIGLNFEELMN